MDELVVAWSPEIGDQYLGRLLPEDRRGRPAEMLPAVRLLRMLRWPGQRAIIWPEVIHENDPLPGYCAARLRILGAPGADEAARLVTDCDYGASLRRCGEIALYAAETQRERMIIALQLAGRRTGRRSVCILDEHGTEADAVRVIPADRFAEVERRLRGRAKARADAERIIAEAVSDAVSLHGPMASEGGRSSMPGDPTGRGADKILRAHERVAEAEAWEQVFKRTEEDFPPGSDEHKCATLHYEAGWTLNQIGEMMHYEKQTVRRKRDAYIYRAAWYAAEAGLMRRDTE